jgi:GTP cyclohydrolase I
MEMKLTKDMITKAEGLELTRCYKRILQILGYENDKGFEDTPVRVANLMIDYVKKEGIPEINTFFESLEGDLPDLITLKGISFASLCPHHLLPYSGEVTIEYKPKLNNRIIGFSKAPRLVKMLSDKIQLQEDLTILIAKYFKEFSSYVKVIVDCTHDCMTCRGVEQRNSRVVTTKTHGSK